MKIAKSDYKFVSVNGDPGFSAEHNRQVIEQVIKESEAYARSRRREHDQQVRERTSAVAEYMKATDMGGKDTDITRYFGEKYMNYLRGKDLIEQARIKVQKGEKVFTKDA